MVPKTKMAIITCMAPGFSDPSTCSGGTIEGSDHEDCRACMLVNSVHRSIASQKVRLGSNFSPIQPALAKGFLGHPVFTSKAGLKV